MRVGGGLGEIGAPSGEADAVVDGDGSGGDQGGDLPERVAGERDDLDVGGVGEYRADGFPDHQRREQDRELGVAGAGEVVGTGVEEQRRQRLAERGLRAVDHRPCRLALPRHAHAGCLGPLAGEHHCDAQQKQPPGLAGRYPTRSWRWGLHRCRTGRLRPGRGVVNGS